jgi:broad specificity phosphatase PhoE
MEKQGDKNQDLLDNYNTLYNQAYQNYQKNIEDAKSTVYNSPTDGNPVSLFARSLWSGLNSWAATRGAGLVAAGLGSPVSDWMRSRQTAAEASDIPDLPLTAGSLLSGQALATRGGKMMGQMAPDLALTLATKNPALTGLEFTASSTLSGMGDVYNQAKADGYNEVEAQQKAQDFAHKNFLTTLPANMVMGSAILANLKGVGGFLANTGKEVAGGLGAALPQQYLTQAEGKEGKTLQQFLQEDAPKSALENIIALAAGAPVMRAVGHLTSAMGGAKMSATDRQFYSDLIDKQGPNAAHATAELQYLNGALDDAGLAQTKQQIDELVKTKTSLTQMDVHPDHQKLFLEAQKDIQDLQAQHLAATDETVKKLLETKIKEKQGTAQDALTGKTPYLKFTTPSGNDFVVPMDKAETVLQDPALQRDLAAGHLRAQAFGKEAETAPVTQRLNEINQSATNTHTAELSVGDNPPPLEAPSGPNITEVRHGETDEDQSGHVSGTDGIPLNRTGQEEVEKLADDAQGRGFTKVVGSDVPRNAETAKAVADRLGVPHETIPGFNSWDVGEWNGAKEEDYNRAENYFVQHPDASEFEGKRVNETFNQYKDRIIGARQELEDKNQGNTLLVNHSGNINVWDAYKASGDKWDEAAKQHYLSAPDAEPGVLPPTPEEEKVATEAETGKSDSEITTQVRDQLVQTNPNFTGRSPELPDFYEKFKDEIGSVKDSSLDYRVNIPDLTQSQREGAVKDIDQGKTSGRATKLLDALEKMHAEGMIDYTRGRGNHVEKMGIPVEHFDRAAEEVATDAEGWKKAPQHIIDAFEEELKNLDNEKASEPAGKIQSGGQSETGDRGNDETSGRSQKATADQKRLPADDKTEGSGDHPKGDTGESEPGRFSTRDEFERSLAQDKLAGEPIEAGGKSHSVEQYVTKAEAVLKQLFPDHSIRTYGTEAEYREKEGRPAGSAGVYDPKGKYIAFNIERIRKMGAENTIFHEVIHPIVHEAMESRPGAIDDAYSRLVEFKDTPGMEAVWNHEEQYRDRGLSTMKTEAITEFLTRVADGSIDPSKFKPTIRTRFIDVVNRVFKALGIDKVISTAQDIGRLADSIKKAFTEADAKPVEEALGRRGGAEGEKMDKMDPEEDKLRKMIQRAPEAMSDKDISASLQKVAGKTAAEADDLVKSVRDEQAKGLSGLVEEALGAGKQTIEQAKKNAPQAPQPPKGMAKVLGRWFFDKQDDVSDVKSIIRRNKGQEEFQADQVWKASNKALNDWNKVPVKQQLQFILGMERPDLLKGSSPETLQAAQSYRDRLDKVYDIIKKALPNINFTEDYFPHFWEKPDEVKNYFANTLSKQPLEGSKSFAKQRFFDTILEGLRKGYKLTTTNPEELVRLAEANAWKFQAARGIFDDMKKMGYLKFSTAADLPADWRAVDDKLFNKIGAYVDKQGDAQLAAGQYMMPPDVAKMMNQYLSLGLKGSLPDFIRNYNNVKNAFQLGIGAFHLGTTSLESTVSGVARGIQLLTTLRPGNMLNGLGQIAASATFVPNLTMDLRRGWKAMSDYHAGLKTADVMNLVNANAKVGAQKMYSLDAKYNMMKAFGRLRADGDFRQIPKLLWNSILYLPESINKPLMEKWVPGLKVGGYLRSLDAELASRKDMSPAALQQAREKIWDSMDDRLGQVVYDNRFMNKTVKDLGFMSIRSLGWTGGTIAAGVKGAGEIPLSGKRLAHGEGLTQRTAYLFALPMTVGFFGAMYMKMTSGQSPQTMEDYFYPKDGTQNPDGTDHRVDLPSYMKDVISYGNSPVKTLLNKTSPIINDAIDLYKNKDFYGAQIYGPEDPVYQKGLDALKYLGENMTPFSFKQRPGDEKSLGEQFGTQQGIQQKFGIMPAPKEMERTDMQNKIVAAYGKQFGSEEGKTEGEMEQMIARRHLRDYLHNGGSWEDASDELKNKANITEQGQQKFINDSQLDAYEKDFRGLPKAVKIKLFEQMSDDEQDQYKKYMPEDYTP